MWRGRGCCVHRSGWGCSLINGAASQLTVAIATFMAKEVSLFVSPPGCRVSMGVGGKEDTAEHVLQELLDSLQLPAKRAWHLYEFWNGCERHVSPNEHLLPLWEEWGSGGGRAASRFHLKASLQSEQRKHRKKKRRQAKRIRRRLLADPKCLLSGRMTYKRLCWLHDALGQSVRRYQRQYSAVLLGRVGRGEMLWGPREPTIIDVMRDELGSLQELNLQLSTEIADLNIMSTRLSSQLSPLRQKASDLSGQLAQLQCEVVGKREERERRVGREWTDTQTELLKLKRELDLRNRLNAIQSTKLESHRDVLTKKQQLLAEKQNELELLKQRLARGHVTAARSHVTSDTSHVTSDTSHVTSGKSVPVTQDNTQALGNRSRQADATQEYNRGRIGIPSTHDLQMDHSPPASGLSTPQNTPPDRTEHRTPSTSKKRYSSIIEARHRQLVEEEGLAFRASQARLHSNEGEASAAKRLSFNSPGEEDVDPGSVSPQSPDQVLSPHHTPEVSQSSILAIPKADLLWYEAKDSPDDVNKDRSKIGAGAKVSTRGPDYEGQRVGSAVIRRSALKQRGSRKRAGMKVRFTAESVVLNAALEGELEVLQECVHELGSCSQTSDKGATCLHNAVCSSSLPTVEYLVEMGCDINSQDVDGWTPLHCAVAYSNLDMIRYLIGHGASLFLKTREGETPAKIGMEEYRLQQESQGGRTNDTTVECLKYLTDVQNSLGLTNNGVVYALFSHQASNSDELGFYEGEVLHVVERKGRADQWWWAENSRGEKGYIPCTHLGTNERHTVIL